MFYLEILLFHSYIFWKTLFKCFMYTFSHIQPWVSTKHIFSLRPCNYWWYRTHIWCSHWKLYPKLHCNHLYSIHVFRQEVSFEHVLWAEKRSKHISHAGVTVVSLLYINSDGIYILVWGGHTTNISQVHSVTCCEDTERIRKWRQMVRCFLRMPGKASQKLY